MISPKYLYLQFELSPKRRELWILLPNASKEGAVLVKSIYKLKFVVGALALKRQLRTLIYI